MVAKGLRKVMCERWVGDWTKTATYWPPVPLSLAALLSRSAELLNQGSWGPIALCWVLVLSTASHLLLTDSKLTEPVCGPGLYNCLTPTCFLWESHLHLIQPVHSQGYTLISSTGCICSLIDGWIEGQYVTHIPIVWSNLNFLDNFQLITFPTQLYKVFYSFELCPGYATLNYQMARH